MIKTGLVFLSHLSLPQAESAGKASVWTDKVSGGFATSHRKLLKGGDEMREWKNYQLKPAIEW